MRKFEPMIQRLSLGLCLFLSALSVHAVGVGYDPL
jgi:hypothetical protein